MKHPWAHATLLGTQMAACVLLGIVVGRALDLRWDSHPWCLLGGLLAGAFAGFRLVIRATRGLP